MSIIATLKNTHSLMQQRMNGNITRIKERDVSRWNLCHSKFGRALWNLFTTVILNLTIDPGRIDQIVNVIHRKNDSVPKVVIKAFIKNTTTRVNNKYVMDDITLMEYSMHQGNF